MEEKKYYTPELSEFHVGFEYEWRHLGSDPTDMEFNKNNSMILPDICHMVNDSDWELRVKYLDKEDIKSLGFIHGQGSDCDFIKDNYEMYFFDNNNRIIIKEKLIESNMNGRLSDKQTVYYQLFDGIIKNKSVFKQVLKMIGVL